LGSINVLRNGYIATGFSVGRLFNIAGSWGALDTESRGKNSIAIDGRCQSKEEYGSDEGLGEHFKKQYQVGVSN
jgi:hypothetical protein